MRSEVFQRDEMVECGRLLWQRNLLGATEGNLSCRLGEDRLLCTPSGFSKGHLSPHDLVVIDLSGAPIDPNSLRPSSEIRMHLGIYQQCPHIEAVVHAHPLNATAFALAGKTIPIEFLPEALVELGPVALVPFAMPGTDEVPDSLIPFLERHRTFLLSNHGAVTTGGNLREATYRMEVLERIAQITTLSQALGPPSSLSPAQLARFEEAY